MHFFCRERGWQVVRQWDGAAPPPPAASSDVRLDVPLLMACVGEELGTECPCEEGVCSPLRLIFSGLPFFLAGGCPATVFERTKWRASLPTRLFFFRNRKRQCILPLYSGPLFGPMFMSAFLIFHISEGVCMNVCVHAFGYYYHFSPKGYGPTSRLYCSLENARQSKTTGKFGCPPCPQPLLTPSSPCARDGGADAGDLGQPELPPVARAAP